MDYGENESLQYYLHFIVVGDNNRFSGEIPEGVNKRCGPAVIFSAGLRLHIVFTLPQSLSYHVHNTHLGTEFETGNFMDISKDNLGNVPAVLVAPKPGVFTQTSGHLQRNTLLF